jgi:ATP phosphoribosyltransferase regulatory subunit
MLGLRADATPQVTRIDAHILNRTGVVRLAYAGSVLHARPLHPLATREPLQVRVELYGHAGLAADAEVLELAIESLRRAGMKNVRLDLGHTGVVRGLLDLAPASMTSADDILSALSSKDVPALERAIADIEPRVSAGLLFLARCNGGIEVIDLARGRLPRVAAIATALDELAELAGRCGADEVSVDLADLHGYRYLTGVTFAVHTPELPTAVLRGGRYDDIGKAFGRARPAVGFSIYLRELARLGPDQALRAIAAPADDEPSLRALIDSLRERGEVVIQALPGEVAASMSEDFVFDRTIVRTNGQWQLQARSDVPPATRTQQ